MCGAVRHRRIVVLELLEVVRKYDAGNAALVVRDANRAIDQMAHLLWNARHSHIFCDILEQVLEIDFLLIARSQSHSRLLADKRDNRHVIHLGVIQPVQQMDRAGPGGRVT